MTKRNDLDEFKILFLLNAIMKEKVIYALEVETLSPNEDYEPYNKVRKFYEKNGFKLIKINPPRKKGWDKMGIWVKKLK